MFYINPSRSACVLSSLIIFALTNQDLRIEMSICRNYHGGQYLAGNIMSEWAWFCLCACVHTDETSKHCIICSTVYGHITKCHMGVRARCVAEFTIIHLMLSSVIRAELPCMLHAETQPQWEWSTCTAFTYFQLWPWASFGDLNYFICVDFFCVWVCGMRICAYVHEFSWVSCQCASGIASMPVAGGNFFFYLLPAHSNI